MKYIENGPIMLPLILILFCLLNGSSAVEKENTGAARSETILAAALGETAENDSTGIVWRG